MGNVITLPHQESRISYADRLQTVGENWTLREKKLIDEAEFIEAMILVLDDVRLQNIQNRDYGMMDIITDEIVQYQQRLDNLQESLSRLRVEYAASECHLAN
ncbi:MAG: hypothetical protein C4527_06060 [Candidatus Omnitrophota bacterium]|jgi:CRISPR/Cas system-associated endonuclease Cas1|nr:MAG: hypothetical protein C4527_06060 [Candidatus Omnitrophota bacterium]